MGLVVARFGAPVGARDTQPIVEGRTGLRNTRSASLARTAGASAGRERRARGMAAEAIAAQFLESRRVRLVNRNYRCRGGEVDLIGYDGATLVFFEVRLRSRSDFGGASASVTYHKQRRVILAAQHYLLGKSPGPCRFDVIAMNRLEAASIEWIRDAFAAQ